MSEPGATLPTVRLLEPRALHAADRIGARIAARTAPFLRSLAGGAIAFSERMFRYWIDGGIERPLSAVTARAPSWAGLGFPVPWYDERPAWPSRGIALRVPSAPASRPAGAARNTDGDPLEPRALDLISTYVEGDTTQADPAPEHRAAPALAARISERLSLIGTLVRAAGTLPPHARPAVAASPTSSGTATGQGLRSAHEPLGLDASLAPASSAPAPRTQRFLESLAGPIVLAQAGAVRPSPQTDPKLIRPGFAPQLPPTFQSSAITTTAPRSIPSFGRTWVAPEPPAVAIPELRSAPMGTALGELAQVAPAAPSTQPGRLAQRAELLGLIAERRIARQLGYPEPEPSTAVTSAADAFTFVELDAALPATVSTASVSQARPPARDPGTVEEPAASRQGVAAATRPATPAALLAFADQQLGPRLLEAARPLSPSLAPARPVSPSLAAARLPELVYVRAPAPSSAVSRVALPAALDAAVPSAASPTKLGGVGLRSEQLAAEVGIRAAALASDFLFTSMVTTLTDAPAVSDRLTTPEWVLLSVFPTAATAQEVATSAVRRGAFAPTAVLAGQLERFVKSTDHSGAPPDDLPPEWRPVSSSASTIGDGPYAATPTRLVDGVTTTFVLPSFEAPATPARGSRLQRLPDGRRPRGNRLAPPIAPPVLVTGGGAGEDVPATPLLAASEAAERRVESPVGAPLWGHLRSLVAPAGPAERGRPPVERPVVGPVSSATSRTGEPRAPRAAALELIAPYVEAARNEPSGAASFAREAVPVVAGRAPDDATRTLVTALSTANTQSSGDRLTMADLTLISMVSAADQVAAAPAGAPPSPTGEGASDASAGSSVDVASGHPDDHGEVERLANRVFDRLRQLVQQELEKQGDSWERQ